MARGLAAALVMVALALPGRAAADELGEFEKARNAYLARAYDEADQRFHGLLDPKTGTLKDRTLLSQARMFWGATLHAKGRKKEAAQIFEQLLLEDPQFEPDPLSFPTAVVNDFIDTRARIRQLLKDAAEEAARRAEERRAREAADRARQAERIALLERLAREETVVKKRSRLVASMPFGAGQFQNGQDALGWFFLGTEAALVVAGSIMVPLYLSDVRAASEAYERRDRDTAEAYVDRASGLRYANLSLYGAFAVTAVAGITHAHLTFQPEDRSSRPREIPTRTEPRAKPQASLLPFVAPAPRGDGPGFGGGMVGVSGRF